MAAQDSTSISDPTQPCNQVRLTGRVAAPALERELPSGDALVSWRVVVDRGARKRGKAEPARVPTVDALECVAFLAGPRRVALTLTPGDIVTVAGALRRRFWRAPGGPTSRYEVEVATLRRVRRAGAPG